MEADLQETGVKTHHFSFTGTAGEYFGIWIVNLLLTIVTVGIYSAWAKVRRLRYFYGNTWLDGHNFEYHAKPLQILIGRIIVFVVLIAANLLSQVAPLVVLGLLVPYFLALPWLINKALSFNARMTSYRNVRFGFEGSYWGALKVFVIVPIIVPVVAGLIIFATFDFNSNNPGNAGYIIGIVVVMIAVQILIVPYLSKLSSEYIGNSTRFGTARFETSLSLKMLYSNFAVTLLPAVGLLVLMGVLINAASPAGIGSSGVGAIQFLVFAVYFAFILGYLAYAAGVRNISFDATRIEGGHGLTSSVPRFGYAWVIFSNLIVTVFSIGLMSAWAAVRTWRYLSNHTSLTTSGTLDNFVDQQGSSGNVAAAEYLDIEGIELGL